jgi:hypothetical protein
MSDVRSEFGYAYAEGARWPNEASGPGAGASASATAFDQNSHYEGYWPSSLADTVFVPASRGCTITINPKSACSTLKFNVWRQEYEMGATPWKPPAGGIHRKRRSAFAKPPLKELEPALFEKPVFSIVRNPYTRLLSAYMDKIGNKIKRPKRQLLVRMGRVQDGPISFGEFVDFICAQNSRQMNLHYAPQSFLMQVHYHPYTHIGCVEAMEESLSAIMAAAYGIERKATSDFRRHRTDASSLIAENYSEEIAAKVLNRFRSDFEVFGYDTDINKALMPPRNLKAAAQIGSRLADSVLRPAIRAGLAEKAGDYTAALHRLSAIKRDEPEIDVMRARLLLRQRRKEEALSIMQSVVQRVGDVGSYWMQLSECLLAVGRGKEAAAAADQAVAVAHAPAMMRSAIRIWKANDRRIMLAACTQYLRSFAPLGNGRTQEIATAPSPTAALKRVWKSEKVAAYRQKIAAAEALEKARPNWAAAAIKNLVNSRGRRR